jgi:hypothetical protein
VTKTTSDSAAAAWLGTAEAVRSRCHVILALAEREALAHFAYFPERLPSAIDYVLAVIRENYPDLVIPFHSRWRHFSGGGRDRWQEIAAALGPASRDEMARVRFDLAIISVLLDAGAGPDWRYREAGGETYTRSEGLAVASCALFRGGLFSALPNSPWRVDGTALSRLDSAALATALQVTPTNKLIGLDGRTSLLRRLGTTMLANPEFFGDPPRLGGLYDHLRRHAIADGLPAAAIFAAILQGLGPVWPGRLSLGGINLGDVWRHSAIRTDDPSSGLIPFHKLSQWLAYSLIEPLEDAGITVTGIAGLTGLAEYRNGGLMIDLGVIAARDPALATKMLKPGDEAVVEWRALTVALLDRIAAGLRERLGLSAEALPLARVLEGGTWAAGRRAAAERRKGGTPPLRIESDGTVF